MNLPKDLEVGTGSLPAADLARRWWCRPGGECAVRLVGLHAGGSASTPALIQGSASTPARGDKTGRRHRATQRPDPCNASTPALTQGSASTHALGGKGGGKGGGRGFILLACTCGRYPLCWRVRLMHAIRCAGGSTGP